eukprot:TRINITY_DN2380_c0_g1::TRINITY_DN2380_c0_g1_i1::g.20662::m.20662 TRINITY_DN2380_c0_g1::TRINITY_DN2380_c0_g1_i1::g.20662  ORF type:complete len:525 (+),score=115.07,sp/Q9Y0C9/RIP3_DICDI/29.17/3e-07,SIN1/PF05422.7/7.9e-08,Peptidase_M16/PF00675.15/0.33,Peptidase_M16/PF00675.15/8.1e+03 TRINITY_DN2380_c0_g1_i1:98-1672(+)
MEFIETSTIQQLCGSSVQLERFLSTSPPLDAALTFSNVIDEVSEFPQAGKRDENQQASAVDDRNEDDDSKKPRVIVFTSSTKATPVPAQLKEEQRDGLEEGDGSGGSSGEDASSLLSSSPFHKIDPKMHGSPSRSANTGSLSAQLRRPFVVPVYLPPDWADPPRKLMVKVLKTSTVDHVICLTIKAATSDPSLRLSQVVPAEYDLRFAEDDGYADMDLPVLSRREQIQQYVTDTHTALALAPGKTSPSSSIINNLKKMGGKGVYLKVSVRKEQVSYIFNFSPDTILRHVLLRLNQKMNTFFSADHHCFHRPEGTAVASALDFNQTVASLNCSEIILCEKDFADKPRHESLGKRPADQDEKDSKLEPVSNIQDFFFSEATASQYKEYIVYKVRSSGRKDRRIMGIDRERVYNSYVPPWRERDTNNPGNRGTIMKSLARAMAKSGTTKNPSRKISDIRSIELVADKPARFVLVYDEVTAVESKGLRQDVYEFEAEDGPRVAAEIVAKIKYLMQLEARLRDWCKSAI